MAEGIARAAQWRGEGGGNRGPSGANFYERYRKPAVAGSSDDPMRIQRRSEFSEIRARQYQYDTFCAVGQDIRHLLILRGSD